MIKPGEIQQKARAVGVRDQQIEKESSMSEQIQDLPDFDKVEREVQRHFKKLDIK
ncbi:hypothetical protein [Parapedobacter tibetensis]|uniref:hypothetical protein n=1 Tax=Parapedobacter tibetensis TaxID=2972951 RepID=UPI00214D78E1|nr:hypothetical protein [Parapedobacter tibetensis]